MATSNIQETGLENSIFFLEPSTYEDFGDDEAFEGMSEEVINEQLNEDFWDWCEYTLPDILDEEGRDVSVEVFDRYKEEWVDVDLTIRIAGCYYHGANLVIVNESGNLEEAELSNTNQEKINRAIRKLEKICRRHSTELGITGRFSNGETVYHKK